MTDFTIRTAEQLPALLKAFRKKSGLTQTEAARRLGVTQQTLSSMERNADKVGTDRLLYLLSMLNVELVLREKVESPPEKSTSEPRW